MGRHERRAVEAQARRGGPPSPPSQHKVLVLVVSYHGIKGQTVKNLFAMEHAVQDAGHSFAFDEVSRTPLDLARSESVAKFLASEATAGLFLDDDCQVDAAWLPQALDLLKEKDLGIITAPCRLRNEKVVFNIAPISPPVEIGGLRVMECSWTGFGCVLIRRDVLQTMHDAFPKLHYHSHFSPGRMACAMFRSEILPRRLLDLEGDPEGPMHVLDDHIWSLRARKLGFGIFATVDVETCHDSYLGNFGATLDVYETEKALRANAQVASSSSESSPVESPEGSVAPP